MQQLLATRPIIRFREVVTQVKGRFKLAAPPELAQHSAATPEEVCGFYLPAFAEPQQMADGTYLVRWPEERQAQADRWLTTFAGLILHGSE